MESLKERPFHVYHPDFLNLLGRNPTLTLIADAGTDPLFHEAVVWYDRCQIFSSVTISYNTARYPPTDEVFIAQSAGPLSAGTGLNKSSVISKISLSEAMAVSNERNAVGKVEVHTVPTEPPVINPNGTSPSRTRCIIDITSQAFSFLNYWLISIRRNKLQGCYTLHRRGNGPRCAAHALHCKSNGALQHF